MSHNYLKKSLIINFFLLLTVCVIPSNAINLIEESSCFEHTTLPNELEEIKGDKIILDTSYLITQKSERISGKITDSTTGAPIPYCNIEVVGFQTGTSSNELGEFILEVDALPVTVIFSHLNYEKKTIEVSQLSTLNIQLTPLVNSLNEVVLSANKRDSYAFELAEKALSTMRKLSDKKKYGRAFYRQKSKNGDEYSEFSEIIYDAIYTSEGIENWEILEGRYALKQEMVNNSNFTLLSRILKSIQPDTDDLIFPLRFNVRYFYDIKIIDMLSSADGDIATLWFKPLENVIAPILDTEVVINTKTYDVLKVSGTVVNDHLEFIKFKEKNTFAKNYQLSYEMVFKKNSNEELLIDYIKVDHAFDYYKDEAFLTDVTSTSNLVFFEHNELDVVKRIRNRFWKRGSDWEALNKIGYNEVFWKNNPIVKRTPVEDEVIASFEKDNAFESIFLNTKEQIAFMQSNLKGDLFIEKFDSTIRNYNNNNPVEKVFLHANKDVFFGGENLWYKAYAVLGEHHRYSMASKVLYVDLIDSNNKLVLSQTHKLYEGQGQGHMELLSTLQAGVYHLRAYTNWMRNFDDDFFFTKKIKLINTSNVKNVESEPQENIDLQFFPEGGYAINEMSGKIAFKAIGSDGLGVKVKGHIENTKGETIVAIRSMYQGMGFFTLKPEPNERYTVILDNGSKYELPKIQKEGYTMFVDNLDPRNVKIKIQASDELRNKPFYIIGLSNNNKQYQGRYKFNAASVIDFEIPKSRLPSGVLTLTLFDETMRPWCERVLFINNKIELNIQTELNKSDFRKRDKFELKVHINDAYGAPLSTNFSVAVTDTERVEKDEFGDNILTYLLLQSDIKGFVENPGYYFNDDRRSTTAKLDLLMLTQGWRKFNWQELENTNFELPKDFVFERGYSISGIAANMQDEPLQTKELKMIAKSGEFLNLYTTKTKEDGSFIIDNVTNEGNVEMAFNVYNENGDAIDTKVTILETKGENNLPMPNFKAQGTYITDSDLVSGSNRPFAVYQDAEQLDEVLVEADKKFANELTKYKKSLFGVEPDHTIMNDDKRSGNILFHFNNIPGVSVDMLHNVIFFRGNPFGPIWIVDGVRMESEATRDVISDAISTNPYQDKMKPNIPDFVYNLDMSNIERVEIIKQASKAAIYGPEGKYGVIIVYTKTGRPKPNNAFTSKHKVQGFSKVKEFYSPKYDVVLEEHKNPDNRATLYWNPSVKTDKNGNATIVFYNSDTAKSFQVDIQALSEYGTPGTYLNTYKK